MNRSMPQHKERLKQISILLTCPSSLLKKFPIYQNTNKMFCVKNIFPSVSLKTIYIFCLFLKTRVCLEGRFQNFMDIGDSKLKCLPARERHCFCQKQKFNENQFLRFYFTLTLGIILKKQKLFRNQKSFNFCIFLFIFPFYLTDNIVEKHIVLMWPFYTMSNKDKTFCPE